MFDRVFIPVSNGYSGTFLTAYVAMEKNFLIEEAIK